MDFDQEAQNASRDLLEMAQHLLTHKPAEVPVEHFWNSMLQVHLNFTVLAIEGERFPIAPSETPPEPRRTFQAVTRLGMVGMIVAEYYRERVDQGWFEQVGRRVDLLPTEYTLRHLASYGLLPGYSEPEPPHEGTGADA